MPAASAQHQYGPHASVCLMCGLPGSGKSSFASAMMRNINNSNINDDGNGDDRRVVTHFDPIILIDYDEIAKSIIATSTTKPSEEATAAVESASVANAEVSLDTVFSEQDLQAWRECRNIALSRLEEELRQYFSLHHERAGDNDAAADKLKATNVLIILDDNFHLRSMRRDIYKVCQRIVSNDGQCDENISGGSTCRPGSIGFSVLMVDTPLATCLERNALREGKARIPEATVQKMASALERPEPNSGDYMKKFEKNSIVIDNSKHWMGEGDSEHDADAIWQSICGDEIRTCLEAAIENPVLPPQREEEVDPEILRIAREQTKKNRLHKADRLLRSLVGVVGRTDKSMGRVANDARKHVLQQLRDDTIPVAVESGRNSGDDDSAYEVEVANAFKCYLAKNSTCHLGSSNVLIAVDEALQKLK